ncbi:hypothetical protein BDY21DRAFT_290816, partial [Lineolata rhizophorae]
MHVRYAPHLLAALSLLRQSRAQDSIPSDLAGSFTSGGSFEIQCSYENDAAEGFADGTEFSEQETSQEPVFALGDSTGVNTALNFLILMVDTTCDNNRVLHYAQPGFQATGDRTQISADNGPAALDYQAPGSFGETGRHQYSFLLYFEPRGGSSFSVQGLPNEGEAFDVQEFQDANDLDDPRAGVAMVVDFGGSVDC